ncbi:MAG: hypothetical protein SH859_15055 [Hyphomicrobium aestuarii]|nr:hypothetical protein [Hyphomicrobium aestuarii]
MAVIHSTLPSLDEEQLAAVAEIVQAWSVPSVYSSLPPAEKAAIDAALDRLDKQQFVAADEVFLRMRERLNSAQQ